MVRAIVRYYNWIVLTCHYSLRGLDYYSFERLLVNYLLGISAYVLGSYGYIRIQSLTINCTGIRYCS